MFYGALSAASGIEENPCQREVEGGEKQQGLDEHVVPAHFGMSVTCNWTDGT